MRLVHGPEQGALVTCLPHLPGPHAHSVLGRWRWRRRGEAGRGGGQKSVPGAAPPPLGRAPGSHLGQVTTCAWVWPKSWGSHRQGGMSLSEESSGQTLGSAGAVVWTCGRGCPCQELEPSWRRKVCTPLCKRVPEEPEGVLVAWPSLFGWAWGGGGWQARRREGGRAFGCGLDSSVGRASDFYSEGPAFKSLFRRRWGLVLGLPL